MSYKRNQSVKIRDSDDNIVDGVILDDIGPKEEYYWVQFLDKDGTIKVEVFEKYTLDRCNTLYNNVKCTCGSDTVKHPSHSYFCDKNEVKYFETDIDFLFSSSD